MEEMSNAKQEKDILQLIHRPITAKRHIKRTAKTSIKRLQDWRRLIRSSVVLKYGPLDYVHMGHTSFNHDLSLMSYEELLEVAEVLTAVYLYIDPSGRQLEKVPKYKLNTVETYISEIKSILHPFTESKGSLDASIVISCENKYNNFRLKEISFLVEDKMPIKEKDDFAICFLTNILKINMDIESLKSVKPFVYANAYLAYILSYSCNNDLISFPEHEFGVSRESIYAALKKYLTIEAYEEEDNFDIDYLCTLDFEYEEAIVLYYIITNNSDYSIGEIVADYEKHFEYLSAIERLETKVFNLLSNNKNKYKTVRIGRRIIKMLQNIINDLTLCEEKTNRLKVELAEMFIKSILQTINSACIDIQMILYDQEFMTLYDYEENEIVNQRKTSQIILIDSLILDDIVMETMETRYMEAGNDMPEYFSRRKMEGIKKPNIPAEIKYKNNSIGVR
jgi:hypothetical protein